ncbi:hypothetical protein Cgig2_028162 [Carnegiea gigantea]|uniref:Uncharacterized protein n=1 Tax=Carnegiea gigantea TaxID=171969 RepID=A0A9Q1QAH1_9CARY|nr:hypothetical protein Cgig2_028162 [Carnegiea gigantea]
MVPLGLAESHGLMLKARCVLGFLVPWAGEEPWVDAEGSMCTWFSYAICTKQQMNTPNSSSNGGQGGILVEQIVEQILEREGYVEEFQRNFGLYIFSTCIIESINGNYFFIIVKFLMDQRPNDTIVEWKKNHIRYFRRPLLFLLDKTIDIIDYPIIIHDGEIDLQPKSAHIT